jgi:hypothetical protein
MRIISCQSCGVLLDGDVFQFPDEEHHYTPDFVIDEEVCGYHNGDWTAKRACPVCDSFIYGNDCG